MKKKVTAFTMAIIMALVVFAACTPDGTVSNEQDQISTDDSQEIVEINMWAMDPFGTAGAGGSKADEVIAAINEYTESEIGVHVNFTWTGIDPTPLVLGISGGEQIDVALFSAGGSASLANLYVTNAAMNMTELLSEYGQGVTELFGSDLLSAVSYNGGVYGISCYRALNSNYYILVRDDDLKAAGVYEKAQNITKWSEWEEVMQALKDSDITAYPIGGGGGDQGGGIFGDAGAVYGLTDDFSSTIVYDTLGDSTNLVYTDQDGNVMLFPETEEYLAQVKMLKRWKEKGYIWPDSAYDQQGTDMLMAGNVIASAFNVSEYGVEVSKSQTYKTDVTAIEVGKGMLTTTDSSKFGVFIPTTSEEPEAAMKFINLLYTSSELMNLMIYGIEGETYVMTDTGVAAYPEGTTDATCGWHNMDFVFGNQFLLHPWEGNEATFREDTETFFLEAPKSSYLGLTGADGENYANLFSALSAVQGEYSPQMLTGDYTEELYQEYIAKLKAAGADEYIAIYQKAVTDFQNGISQDPVIRESGGLPDAPPPEEGGLADAPPIEGGLPDAPPVNP